MIDSQGNPGTPGTPSPVPPDRLKIVETIVEAKDVTVVTVVEVVVDVTAVFVVVTEVEAKVCPAPKEEPGSGKKEIVNTTVKAATIVGKRMFLIQRA